MRENYDLLLEHDLTIVGEVVVPVRLCLAALPGQALDDIERVYSHIQALGQAEAFLRARPWQLLTTYNTAGAGKSIVDRGERGAAAVLSPRAAALFGLEILADDIGDLPGNRTRFLVLAPPAAAAARPAAARPAADHARHRGPQRARDAARGARVFASHGLNMSKLESRPSRERAWEYVFWVDLDADGADPRPGRARRARGRHDDAARAGQLPARRGAAEPRPLRPDGRRFAARSSSRISVSSTSSAGGAGWRPPRG